MQLTLIRRPSLAGATIGRLWLDGKLECLICEDVVRHPSAVKVHGKTAIPAGTYGIIVDRSNRFSAAAGKDVFLPLLLNVPGFAGIRIHTGNRPTESEGCLLPGTTLGPDGASVMGSRVAFTALFAKIRAALARHEQVKITITNPS